MNERDERDKRDTAVTYPRYEVVPTPKGKWQLVRKANSTAHGLVIATYRHVMAAAEVAYRLNQYAREEEDS